MPQTFAYVAFDQSYWKKRNISRYYASVRGFSVNSAQWLIVLLSLLLCSSDAGKVAAMEQPPSNTAESNRNANGEQPSDFSFIYVTGVDFSSPRQAISDLTSVLRGKRSLGAFATMQAYKARAQEYEKIKQYKHALDDYTNALQNCDSNENRYFVLEPRSSLYEKMGQKQNAVRDAEMAYRYAYFLHSPEGTAASYDHVKRLKGKDPPVPLIKNDKGPFLISVLQKLDGANGDWSQPVLTAITGQQFEKRSDPEGRGFTLKNKKGFRHITTDDEDRAIDFRWETDQCTVRTDNVKHAFGEGIFTPERMVVDKNALAALVFKRSWGGIGFYYGYSLLNQANDIRSVRFWKTPPAKLQSGLR
jgi:tetratricopeptide (TPR) repeat protein